MKKKAETCVKSWNYFASKTLREIDDRGCQVIRNVIKIGYTGAGPLSRVRNSVYGDSGFRLIKAIPGGTRDTEARFIELFKHLTIASVHYIDLDGESRVYNSTEQFDDTTELRNIIDNLTLEEMLTWPTREESRSAVKRDASRASEYVCRLKLTRGEEISKELKFELEQKMIKSKNPTSVMKDLLETYGVTKDELDKVPMTYSEVIDPELKEVYSSKKRFNQKFRGLIRFMNAHPGKTKEQLLLKAPSNLGKYLAVFTKEDLKSAKRNGKFVLRRMKEIYKSKFDD